MSDIHSVRAKARNSYHGAGLEDLTDQDLAAPWNLIQGWWHEAVCDKRIYEPGAMSLATVDAHGLPNVRTVLLKDLGLEGLTFYTNLGSVKGQELVSVPQAALLFSWVAAFRQMRFRGPVTPVDRQDALQYWTTRPRDSQIASTASAQSSPVASREELQARVREVEAANAGQDVPLPPFWGGFRLRPVEVELWVGMPSRLHDRIRWSSRDGLPADLADAQAWSATRLQP